MPQKVTVNYSTEFSRCISKYIESSRYTVYKISQITGLGRTAIHQVMSGKMLPTRDFFERLCAVFLITPQQKAELTELYFKEKIGEKHYREASAVLHKHVGSFNKLQYVGSQFFWYSKRNY